LNEVVRKHQRQTVVVVTHGGLVSSMFRHVAGIDLGAERHYSLQNGAYNSFTFEEEKWTVETWGDISHFPPRLQGVEEGFAESVPQQSE
jgi:2,3-bisphosphoglycerate-dependent phosphoglycerate mutase